MSLENLLREDLTSLALPTGYAWPPAEFAADALAS